MNKGFIASILFLCGLAVNAAEFDSITTTNYLAENVLAGSVSEGTGHATGMVSHAEGLYTKAYGDASHAEGVDTEAIGYASHAAGQNASATNDNTYVWSDGASISSTTTNQVTIHALNGIRLLGGAIEGDGSKLVNVDASTFAGNTVSEFVSQSEFDDVESTVDAYLGQVEDTCLDVSGSYGEGVYVYTGTYGNRLLCRACHYKRSSVVGHLPHSGYIRQLHGLYL
jgi:hypothetical protein